MNFKKFGLKALITVFLLICTYLLYGRPIFESNDDPGMLLITAGMGFCSSPDEHILFSHFLIGHALAALNSISPELPWYSIYLLTAQILAVSVILHFFTRLGFSKTSCLIALIAYLTCALRSIELMQFTTTSGLLASAACLKWQNDLETNNAPLNWSIGAVIFAFASLIRVQSALLVMILFLINNFAQALPNKNWKTLRAALLMGCLAVAISASVDLSNKQYYAKDDWKDWYRLNALQARVLEFGRNAASDQMALQACKSVGWSQSDLEMLRSWYFLDANTYSIEKIERICTEYQSAFPQVSILELFEKLRVVGFDETLFATSFALLAATIFSKNKLATVLQLTCTAGLCLILTLYFKLPIQVYAVVLSYTTLVALDKVEIPRQRKFLAVCSAALFLTLILSYTAIQNRLYLIRNIYESYKTVLKNLNPRPQDLYIDCGGSMRMQYILPFENVRPYFKNLNLLPLSAQGRSPLVLNRIRKWDLEPTLCNADRSDIYFVATCMHRDFLNQHFLQHCKATANWQMLIRDEQTNLEFLKLRLTPIDSN